MRDIKFRAWINTEEYKGMYYPNEKNDVIQFIIYQDGFSIVDCNDEYLKDSEYIIEQSTGLKDENGKEIYEGDIVKYPDGIKHICCDFSGNQIVEYINGSFSPFCGCGGEYSMTPHDTIVVGNIHENAELVEKDIEKR
mgnify:CR=1 FL=1